MSCRPNIVPLFFFLLINDLLSSVSGCTLPEWSVAAPTADDIVINLNDSGNTINIKYKADNQVHEFRLWDRCNIPNGRQALPDTVMTVANTEALDADQCKDIDATITLMVAALDGTNIYKDMQDNKGEINFCVELVLLLPENSGVVVNDAEETAKLGVTFHQLNTTVNVDYTNGFEITSVALTYDEETVSTKDKTVEYDITSCQCDVDAACYESGSEVAITQSSPLFLCFELTAPDVVIKHVKTLDFSQVGGVNGVETKLSAVAEPSAWNALTEVLNEDTQKVQVKSRLIELFFQDIAPITASGELILDFKATSRNLQEVDSAVSSRKLLQVAKVSVDNIPLEHEDSSGAAMSTVFLFCIVPIVLLF